MKDNQITVVVMTYNQKDYIVKAIRSILEQQIDVGFNILVHDDCSNDGTYELLLNLQKNNKDRISIIRQNTRKFPLEGFNQMLYKYVVPKINSRFVAYCDGDDFWIDKYKLKKQYDFMINNNEYALCCHSAYQLRRNNDFSSKRFIKPEGDIELNDIISDDSGVCIATSSIFIKAEIFKTFPNWRMQYPVEDVPMFICAALNGKIHRLKDIMCVYRQFSSGSWSAQNKNDYEKTIKHLLTMIDSIKGFDNETGNKYHALVDTQINGYRYRIALLKKDFPIIFNKENRKIFRKLDTKEKISLFFQYKMPTFYRIVKHSRKSKKIGKLI